MTLAARRLDLTLGALSHPTRRAILQALARGDARLGEVAAPFPMSLPAVSKHVQVLERAGLVKRRRQGREHVLSFREQPLGEVSTWMTEQRALWAARLEALDGLLRAEDAALAKRKARKGKRS